MTVKFRTATTFFRFFANRLVATGNQAGVDCTAFESRSRGAIGRLIESQRTIGRLTPMGKVTRRLAHHAKLVSRDGH